MIYCVSDIHGDFSKYKKLLQKIEFSADDILFVVGDVVDRGRHASSILLDMMQHDNIIPLIGNHDFLAALCLRKLTKEVTNESIDDLDTNTLEVIFEWLNDGGEATLKDFSRRSPQEKEAILDYLNDFESYAEVHAGGKDFILSHAGLGNFMPEKRLEDYTLADLAFSRTDYSKQLFQDKFIVTGHTPTGLIPGNPNPGYVYRANNYIAIDCGCGFGGRLGAICLDTGEEFYVEY